MPAKVWCWMYMLHMQPSSWLGRAMSENHLSATWKGPRGVGEVTPVQSQRKHSSPAFPLGFFCIHQSAFWERASFLHKESHCSCVFWLRHSERFRSSSPWMCPPPFLKSCSGIFLGGVFKDALSSQLLCRYCAHKLLTWKID